MWLKSAFKLSAAKSVYGSVGQGLDHDEDYIKIKAPMKICYV